MAKLDKQKSTLTGATGAIDVSCFRAIKACINMHLEAESSVNEERSGCQQSEARAMTLYENRKTQPYTVSRRDET